MLVPTTFLSVFRVDPLAFATHIQENLPKMRIGAHVRQRRGGLAEGEDAIDRKLELAVLDRLPKIGLQPTRDLAHFFQAPSAESHANILNSLQCMQVEIEW